MSSITDTKDDTQNTLPPLTRKRQAADVMTSTPKRPNQAATSTQDTLNSFSWPDPSTQLTALAKKPQALDRTTETLKFYQKKLDEAAELWIKQKGGEDRLGDANTNFLRSVQMVSSGISMQAQLNESREAIETAVERRLQQFSEANKREQSLLRIDFGEDFAERMENTAADTVEKRLEKFDEANKREQIYLRLDLTEELERHMESIVEDAVSEAVDRDELFDYFKDRFLADSDSLLSDDMIKVKKFVLNLIKAFKDTPETAQDIQREHDVEIGW